MNRLERDRPKGTIRQAFENVKDAFTKSPARRIPVRVSNAAPDPAIQPRLPGSAGSGTPTYPAAPEEHSMFISFEQS